MEEVDLEHLPEEEEVVLEEEEVVLLEEDEVVHHQEVEVVLVEVVLVEVVPKLVLKLSSNLTVTKVSTLPEERKTCCVPRIWFLVKVSMVKREFLLT